MRETSTPDYRKRSLLNASAVSSPRRKSIVATVNETPTLHPADEANDEVERSNRRSMVAMQRRLTNITSANRSPLVDATPILQENQIQDHLRICAKLYTENRISAKNAWQLHVIDVMRKVASTDNANVLQVAGTSLDIGAKVYGLRVDDIHAKGLQLASTMSKSNENRQPEDNDEDADPETSIHQEQRRRTARKKIKKLAADKRCTVDKEEKSLYVPIKHVESVVFATKENIEISATDNLFTHKLPINPANHQFMLASEDKYWSKNHDNILENPDKLIEIEIPEVSHFDICLAFKDFEIGTWDPEEEEERLLDEAVTLPEAILDADGIPIAELDGSVNDIFENDVNIPEDPTSDVEEQEVFQAQIHGEVAPIVDSIPEESRVETDYGYNTLVRTLSGKYIDKIWAGPSHWKVKFNRRSSARYSGTTVLHVVKHSKKTKTPQPINFSEALEIRSETIEEFVVKRAPPTSTLEKITLPVPELLYKNFDKLAHALLMKPEEQTLQLHKGPLEPQDCDLNGYNYENPNDSNYCLQNVDDDANGEPMLNSFEEEGPLAAQEDFLRENLVNIPEIVAATHIPYAMQAKKMDMKKLKGAVWKRLTQSVDLENKNAVVKPTKFSSLYQAVPKLLTMDMRKELTCPLALVALLHLCNENDLLLKQESGCNDFTIAKAEE